MLVFRAKNPEEKNMKKTFLPLMMAALLAGALLLGSGSAMAQSRAQTVADTWNAQATVGSNVDFGFPATTNPSLLPVGTQAEINGGTVTAFNLARLVFGFF